MHFGRCAVFSGLLLSATVTTVFGQSAQTFIPVTPCRVADTRLAAGTFGGPRMEALSTRSFPIPSSSCGIPSTATAYSLNVTVVPFGGLSYLTIWPSGVAQPVVSTLNSNGAIVANAAIVPAGSGGGAVSVYVTDPTHVILDIDGYFVPSGLTTTSMGTVLSGSNGAVLMQSPNDGSSNLSLGLNALQSATPNLSNAFIGAGNTAFGDAALEGDTIGSLNTAVGAGTLSNNITGTRNTALGYAAMGYGVISGSSGLVGSSNTAVGVQSLAVNSTGSYDVAIGDSALRLNTSGQFNSVIGGGSMQTNTTGSNNVAVGFGALSRNTTGSQNIAVGNPAMLNNTTGSRNIEIGFGSTLATGNDNIYIGSAGGSPSENSTIRIGVTEFQPNVQTATFIAAIRGVTTGNSDSIPVVIDSNGQLGTISSSRHFKKDITDMGAVTDNLMNLRPVTFRYKQPFKDGSEPIQYGLIAEEVAEVYPDLVARSADGQIESVKYQVLDSMLLNEVQKQQKKINAQESTIQLLESRLATLEQLLSKRSDANSQSSAH